MVAEDPKQPRQPWRFTVDGGEPFAFAGLCTRKEWEDEEDRGFEDGWLYSCTIVTTTPNEVVAKVHDRMPAILPSAEAEAAWLRPDLEVEDAIAMCAPLPASRMEGAPANPKLNKVGKGIEGPRAAGRPRLAELLPLGLLGWPAVPRLPVAGHRVLERAGDLRPGGSCRRQKMAKPSVAALVAAPRAAPTAIPGSVRCGTQLTTTPRRLE